MSYLFTPIKLKDVTIANRIVMPPMCQYSAETNGASNDWHLAHYTARAVGRVGLIIVEATGVEPRGRITDSDLGLWSDEHVAGLSRIVRSVHGEGAKIGVQIAHAGRKSTVPDGTPVAPSPIPYDNQSKTPHELTKVEISNIVDKFKDTAIRADKAGFDLIEVHAAHGYLLSEFLSPVTNKRQDEYGGGLKGRMRFLREVLEAVRPVWPDSKPISVRISAVDHAEGGVTLEDSTALVRALKEHGVDIWHISSGGLAHSCHPPSVHPGFQTTYSEEVKKTAGVLTIAVGAITTPELAEEILGNNRADMVPLGRELLRNPYWALNAARELGVDLQWPKQYERAKL